MLLLLKASIRGGATSDLFSAPTLAPKIATPVDVKGYVTPDGTYVAPHQAIRHKRPDEPAAAKPAPAHDLFSHAASRPATEESGAPRVAGPAAEAPAPAMPEAAEDAGAPAKAVPDRVLARLKRYLADLQHASNDLGQAREAADGQAAGDGAKREADVYASHAKAVTDALSFVRRFRNIVAGRGVDADAVLAGLGGVPDLSPSEGVRAFMERAKEDAAAAPPPTQAAAGPWGVPAGTGPATRRRLNLRATEVLQAKRDDEMTEEDRVALAQYTGNGGCGDSLNEFYTDPAVATAMWKMLANLGFTGGEVLEPSCGTGVFMRTAPDGARVTGVELDPVSARIANILHTGNGHDVRPSSLERFATQDGGLFDAVIGNAPFGTRGKCMLEDPDKRGIGKHEQYFLDTGLDKLRDGGLMAMIVDTGVMNSKNGRAFRERLLRKAEFLGAHRMPNTAFQASNTDVTTDILLFRKRPADVAGALATFSQKQMRECGVWDADFLSGYFEKRGAPNVYGVVGEAMRAFGPIYTVNGSMDGVADVLAAWSPGSEPVDPGPDMVRILSALGDDETSKARALAAAQKRPYQTAKLGDVRVIDGVRYILQGEPPRWHKLEGDLPAAVNDALKVSEGLDDLLEGRAKDPGLRRAEVAEALDRYIAEHGLPAKNKDLLAWLAAPVLDGDDGDVRGTAARAREAQHRVARLLGAVNRDGSYSDLITGRLEKKSEAGLDSVATVLAADKGRFTVDELAAESGKSAAEVLDHLHASSNYAIEADGKGWTTVDAYLSGELWPKFDEATAALESEALAPEYRAKYQMQAKALEEVISPASLEDVEVALNSGFILPRNINAFFAHQEAERRENGGYVGPESKPITVSYDDGVYAVHGQHWDRDRKLLDHYLNRTGVRKDDRADLERLNAAFADWVRTGPDREEIEERYNRLYKGFRQREYSDAPMFIPGLTQAIDVNAYHFSGLRWALEEGKGIIADDVGLGKTGRGLMLAKLAKIHGTAAKPTFVVPKSVLANWVEETQFWFPGSRVLVIGESYEQNADGSFKRDKDGKLVGKPDTEAMRREKFHALQQNTFDFVLISRPSWDKLDLSPIKKGEYAEDDFWTKRADKLGKAGDKRLNKIRDAHQQALVKRDFKDREGTIYFDDLGIDCLIMDEGHAYKNLFSVNNRFGMSPKFLGGSGESNRAQDTYFKTKYVRENNAGKGVFLLTATPTKNSPLEIYSMLSHIAPEAFEHMGIKNSEDFVDRFVEFVDDEVFGVSGEMEEALVTAGFKNLGELREVMRRYISRRTAEDVGLKLPDAERLEHLLDMTPEQEAVYGELRQQAADSRSGQSDGTGESHIFSIMSRMQKASTDLALLDAGQGAYLGRSLEGGSPKYEAMAEKAVAGAEDGGQIIFCEPVDSHERIADALVKRGVKRSEIAIVNAKVVPSSSDRQKVSDAFNAGKVKYVIGNKTMEEGMNLQKRTSDIHHLDIPWEPATLQQRNGRGLRQGNKNKNLRIHTYLAKRSFDVYRHQTIAAKRNWQDLLWNGGDRVENLAREGAFSLRDVSVMLSPDPEAAMAKMAADKEAAVERKAVANRARAAESFKRFRSMKVNLAKLEAEKRADTPAGQRLKVRMDRQKELLARDAAFPHKDLLDSDEAAVVEPVTGVAWRKGMGLEVASGPDAPLQNDTGRPARYVVDVVDAPNDRIWVRSLAGDALAIPFKADDLQSGVSPYHYTKEVEDAARAEYARTIGADKLKAAKTYEDIMALPTETIAELAPMLQARLKEGLRNYTMSLPYGASAFIHPNGDPVVKERFEERDALATHDLMLPIPEHQEKAIDAYVRHENTRLIESRYGQTRHGRLSRNTGEVVGMVPKYPGAKYDRQEANPWHYALPTIHGKAAMDEAKQRFVAGVAKEIADQPSKAPMYDAMLAASRSVEIAHHADHARGWPAPVVKALWDRAVTLGVLDSPVRDQVLPPGLPSRDDKAAGHSRLYLHGYDNWLSKYAVGGGPPSLRRFLQAVAPASLKPSLLDNAG